MDKINLHQEYERLKNEIHAHNYRYYVLNAPIISDYEYDQLMTRLQQIEAMHPEWITPDSPSQRVGAMLADKFRKVRHPAPILSLASVTDIEGVRAWYDRISRLDERVVNTGFTVEPKIDGLTVVLHYQNGVFIQGATRGDGEFGEDITANLRTIRAIPLRIPVADKDIVVPRYLVVRGEVFIFIKDFENLNRKLIEAGEKPYLNPRNTASGSLRQLDPALTASRPLTILVYGIVMASDNIPPTQWETLEYLRRLGFPVSEYSTYAGNIDEVVKICEDRLPKRDVMPFEADGMVIKVNNLTLANELGFVGKDPRGALALKYPAREVTTLLREIRVNVGRTGVLTPYAVLEPVEVGGVIVKQATLHNFDYIAEKDIREGDRVMIKRAGDVIPYVIGPVVEARSGNEPVYTPPTQCPVCQQPVQNIPGEVAWYCINASCPAQLVRNLEHFVSRPAMDIAGLGIRIVEQLVEAGLVKDVADLYTLKREDLLKLEGFAERKADNLLNAIDQSRQRPLGRLINALGIQGIGEVTANDLTRYYEDLDALSRATVEELQAIEGIGPNTAEAIVEWFQQPANRLIVEKLKKAGVFPKSEPKSATAKSEQPFEGLTFVITGTLPTFSRTEVTEFIQNKGGKVSSSVSKNTDYLVVGEDAGSKLDKAKQLGVKIIDEAQLLKLSEKKS